MNDVDVIIVGSGPAGVSAAWPLLEAGVRVLMLDASSDPLPTLPMHESIGALRRDPGRMSTEFGATSYWPQKTISPKFATPLAQSALAGFAETLGISSRGFMPVGSLAAGGLSRIWGALAIPYEKAELTGFPDYANLATSFRRVAKRIGLAKMSLDLASPRLTEPARRILKRDQTKPADRDIRLAPAPNAVLSEPLGERSGCNACGLCLHGCAKGAIYGSVLELPALSRHRLFSYRPKTRVLSLRRLPLEHGVEVISDGQIDMLRARCVVLTAGTIATTAIAVRRLGLQGRRIRLLSNPVGGMALVVPELIGADLPESSFGLGQLTFEFLSHSSEPGAAGEGMFGVLYGADTLPLSPIADRMPFTRATSLRLARALAPALLLASGYLPGDLSENHLVVEGSDDAGGIRIEGTQTPEADARLKVGFASLARFARRRGAWKVPGSTTILPPGSDAHPVGTLPMLGAGALATEANGELRGCPGIFIADGACMPMLAAKHPTLTIMANADRIGRHVAKVILDECRHALAG